MEMLWHDDISVDDEAIFAPRFLQYSCKQVATLRRTQLRQAVIATAGDEMQVLGTVVAMEALGHGLRLTGCTATDSDRRRCWSVTNPTHSQRTRMSGAPAQSKSTSPRTAYGLTPPVWQSLQFTAVISPRSTGCLKATPGSDARLTVFPCSCRMVWQSSQSLRITLPSGLTWFPS